MYVHIFPQVTGCLITAFMVIRDVCLTNNCHEMHPFCEIKAFQSESFGFLMTETSMASCHIHK